MIRKADNLFAEILDYCNGADEDIVTVTECTIPLATLTAEPFSLQLDESIDFKVMAHNTYGSSEFSALGGGALIQLVPDAPIDLADDTLYTTATEITFTWSDGVSDGGASVIDYRIYYDQSTDTWIELDTGITVKTYTTTVALIEGHTYSFKTMSRNSVGYGELSDPVSILAAQIPD